MAKPTGFMEYPRELPLDRAPAERIKDWQEFHLHFAEEKLRQQGARCMDCGIPFCHTGTLLSGMAWAAPSTTSSRNGTTWFYCLQVRFWIGWSRPTISNLRAGFVRPAKVPAPGPNEPAVTIKTIECAILLIRVEVGWIVSRAAAARKSESPSSALGPSPGLRRPA